MWAQHGDQTDAVRAMQQEEESSKTMKRLSAVVNAYLDQQSTSQDEATAETSDATTGAAEEGTEEHSTASNNNEDERQGSNQNNQQPGDPKPSIDPYQNSHGLPVYTTKQFLDANGGKSYMDIITQQPWKDAFPGGPTMRMVINPQDGKVMDMRHVMVVGFGGGNLIGLGVEVGQWLGPYYGNPGARESAFDPQDFYSNNIGQRFVAPYLFTYGFAKDWSSSFYSWINKK